jgi:hypothetical protein
MILLIYLIGFILSYYLCKSIDASLYGKKRTWGDVILGIIVSIFSWIGVLSCLFIWCVINIEFKKDPPDWL